MKYFIWFGIITTLLVANACAIATATKSESPKGAAVKPKREALVFSNSGNRAANYLSPSLKYLPPTPLGTNQAHNQGGHDSSSAGFGLSGGTGGGYDFAQVGAPQIKTYVVQTQSGHGSAHNGGAHGFAGGIQLGAGHSGGAVYSNGAAYSGGAGHNGGSGYNNGAIYISGGGYSGNAGHNGGALYSSGAGYSSGTGHNGGGAAGHNGAVGYSSAAGYSGSAVHNGATGSGGGASYSSGAGQSTNKAGYSGSMGYSSGATHSGSGAVGQSNGAGHRSSAGHSSRAGHSSSGSQGSSGGTLYSSGAGHSGSGGAVQSSSGGGYSSISHGADGYSSGAGHRSSGSGSSYGGSSGGGYKRGYSSAGGGGQHYSSGASHYYGGSGYSGYKSNHKSEPFVKTFVIPVGDIYKGESGGHGGHLHLGPKIHVVGAYGGGGGGGGGGGHGHGHQYASSAGGFGNAHIHVLNGGSSHAGGNNAATLDGYLGHGGDGAGTLESYLGGALVLGGLAHSGVQGGNGGGAHIVHGGSGGGGGGTVAFANHASFGAHDYTQSAAQSASLSDYGITADVTVTTDHGADGGAGESSYQNSLEDTPSYAAGHKGLGHFGFSASKPQALSDNFITLGKSGYAVYSGKAPFKPSTFLGNTHEASSETGSQYLPPTSAGYQYESPSVLQGGSAANGGSSHSGSYLPPHRN